MVLILHIVLGHYRVAQLLNDWRFLIQNLGQRRLFDLIGRNHSGLLTLVDAELGQARINKSFVHMLLSTERRWSLVHIDLFCRFASVKRMERLWFSDGCGYGTGLGNSSS